MCVYIYIYVCVAVKKLNVGNYFVGIDRHSWSKTRCFTLYMSHALYTREQHVLLRPDFKIQTTVCFRGGLFVPVSLRSL